MGVDFKFVSISNETVANYPRPNRSSACVSQTFWFLSMGGQSKQSGTNFRAVRCKCGSAPDDLKPSVEPLNVLRIGILAECQTGPSSANT